MVLLVIRVTPVIPGAVAMLVILATQTMALHGMARRDVHTYTRTRIIHPHMQTGSVESTRCRTGVANLPPTSTLQPTLPALRPGDLKQEQRPNHKKQDKPQKIVVQRPLSSLTIPVFKAVVYCKLITINAPLSKLNCKSL